MIRYTTLFLAFAGLLLFSCQTPQSSLQAEQWQELEISLTSEKDYANPYTEVEVYADFTDGSGTVWRRPAFWDGVKTWKIRFAPPVASGTVTYRTVASDAADKGLHGQSGSIRCGAYRGDNTLLRHGLLRMSEGKRNVVHADGTPFFMVGDTPWALPWRATPEAATTYAQNRQERGFNTALLMSLLPDRGAEGPRDRSSPGSFDVAFEDLAAGHLNQPNVAYFQTFDELSGILVAHGIVPVYQPVFHGYGWKGKNVLGWDVDPQEYARYCRYLVARYGARPAMWLVGGDGIGKEKGVKEGGEEVEQWDAYRQPTGIHYNPFDDYVPENQPAEKGFHGNKSYQEEEWLDFQWAQTGHGGKHLTHKVAQMYENKPTKAVANGEPTYEGIRDPENAAGWWQGHEAWSQVMAGGTMGVVYGAGGLWQWKLTKDEPGWPAWANSEVAWSDAILLPGSQYVGYLSRAFRGFDTTDMEKHPELANGQPLLAKPGSFYASYLPEGGELTVQGLPAGIPYRWFNPQTGAFEAEAKAAGGAVTFVAPGKEPWVLLVGEQKGERQVM
jgi:hypothetical protein